MPFVCGCRVAFPFEHMAQMPSTPAANDLSPGHAQCTIGNSLYSARYRIEVSRPAAARLEFVVRLVELGIAASTFLSNKQS